MTDIRITRSAGQNWDARFNDQTAPCKADNCADRDSGVVASVSEITGNLGPMGTQPAVPLTLQNLPDVSVTSLAPGDVLRYAGDKWRNYNETNLTDGGNF